MKSRFIPCLAYKDAEMAIRWLCDAFGFEEKAVHRSDDGKVIHSELVYKGNMIMVGSSDSGTPYSKLITHPSETGGLETQSPYVVIDHEDIDAHYQKAKDNGAKIIFDLTERDYEGKDYTCYDPGGHLWTFGSYDPFS